MKTDSSTTIPPLTPQWGTADAEIKVPSGEKTELKRSPFKVWSRSVYSQTCHAYCQEYLANIYPSGPFTFPPVLDVADTPSCVDPQNKIDHPAGCRFPSCMSAEYK